MALVSDGASRGTILYGMSSADNVASEAFSLRN